MKKLLIALLISMPLLAVAEADYNINIYNKTNKFIKLVSVQTSCIKSINPNSEIIIGPEVHGTWPSKMVTIKDSNNWGDWSNKGTRCNQETKKANFSLSYSDHVAGNYISAGKVGFEHYKNYDGDWETLIYNWADKPLKLSAFCATAPSWDTEDCKRKPYVSNKDLNINMYIDNL